MERRHLRIKQLMDVTWSMPGEDITGQGQVLNISSSGILLQIDNSFKPLSNSVLSVDSEFEEEKPPFVNKKGKVMWFRRINTSKYAYQCGLEFLEGQSTDKEFLDWIEDKTVQLGQTMNASILNNYGI
ncbi:MAG: PilZ domain-containing protein [Candidatus Omnitrophica bacterium]|nr:PilZ domain-containing protein [Candidatus Omnitrophota bacterium]